MAQMQTRGSRTTLVVAVVALVISLAAAGYAYAAQTSVGPATSKTAPQNREFTLVTDTIAFNETIAGVPHDVFSPTFMRVNQGDTVVVHFVNTEEANERHSFTMPAYNIDVDLGQGQKRDIK